MQSGTGSGTVMLTMNPWDIGWGAPEKLKTEGPGIRSPHSKASRGCRGGRGRGHRTKPDSGRGTNGFGGTARSPFHALGEPT